MSELSGKKVLIYYRYFGRKHGGGDYLPLTLVSELQKSCEVTLALDWEGHFDLALKFYGIPIDLSRLAMVQLMPKDYRPTDHSMYLSFLRFRKLKKLAKHADICISGDNIMDFGRPAHHFLSSAAFGDQGFYDFVNKRSSGDARPLSRRLSGLADKFLRKVLGMRTRREIIGDPNEHIYPNSRYIAGLLREYYGSFNGRVFYPPTVFDFGGASAVERDPLKVVYIGRLEAAKGIAKIVSIVEKARALSGRDLKLSFAGRPYSEAYRSELEKLTIDRPWVDFPGELSGKEKAEFLLSAAYAVHAMRKEAFGISITEYLKAGVIPVVPDEGGACEVTDAPALTYRNDDEAAEILAKLIGDAAFREEQRRHCAKRAEAFSADAYMKSQHELLQGIVGS
jgi:glycosyltransferase involved in cell wall biosynthesis